MNIKEAIELLKEMQNNCIKGMMKGAIYTDEKALAIETVLETLELQKAQIELLTLILEDQIKYGTRVTIDSFKNENLKDILKSNYISKDKIREKIEELKKDIELKGEYIVGGNSAQIDVLQELLEEEHI